MNIPLQQSTQFARALRAIGVPVLSNDPVVTCRKIGPLGRIGLLSRGPFDTNNLRALRDSGVHLINAEADTPQLFKGAGFRQIITPAHIAEWDLSGCLDQRRKNLHQKWRHQLGQAERAKLSLRIHLWDGADHPMFHYAKKLARKRKFRPFPTSLLATFATENTGDAVIFEASACNQLIASILVLRHGATATLQTAWTSQLGRIHHAHNLLLFEAANWLSAKGHSQFDLGLVETDHAATLARFKLRTGARLRRLGGTWIAVPGL